MRLYLDVCCLNRPFDDHTQERVRLESETVLTILERCQRRTLTLLSSEIIDYEMCRIPDGDRKQKLRSLKSISRVYIIVTDGIVRRSVELSDLGFRAYDALHIACAEKGRADVFLTTDDSLLKRAVANRKTLMVQVENPLRWALQEVLR